MSNRKNSVQGFSIFIRNDVLMTHKDDSKTNPCKVVFIAGYMKENKDSVSCQVQFKCYKYARYS